MHSRLHRKCSRIFLCWGMRRRERGSTCDLRQLASDGLGQQKPADELLLSTVAFRRLFQAVTTEVDVSLERWRRSRTRRSARLLLPCEGRIANMWSIDSDLRTTLLAVVGLRQTLFVAAMCSKFYGRSCPVWLGIGPTLPSHLLSTFRRLSEACLFLITIRSRESNHSLRDLFICPLSLRHALSIVSSF
jgi:hypothetical protein